MNPEEQRTIEVLRRLYQHLFEVKEGRGLTHYADGCFMHGFDIPYEPRFFHFIQWCDVVNNIPWILDSIGHGCEDRGWPALNYLVVNKETGKCGRGVYPQPEVSLDVERQAVYECNDYPQPGSQQAAEFLNRVLERLRARGLTRE
jgi:hypothetical protein